MQRDPALRPDELSWVGLNVVGDDAVSFLQSQLSQDLERDGAWPRWSAVLDPDGSVLSAGEVAVVAGGLQFVVPAATLDAVVARLTRFRLRARLTMTSEGVAHGPYASRLDQIRDGWPGPEEFAARLVAQSFGARFVARTVSFEKGCFTGQELVGRLDARASSVPWRLVRARGESMETLDAFLRSAGPAGPSGVTSWVKDAGGVLALGFAHRTLATLAPPPGVAIETLA